MIIENKSYVNPISACKEEEEVIVCFMTQAKQEITPEARELIKSLVQKARENPFYGFRQSVKGVFALAVMTGKIPGNILERLHRRIDKMSRI